MKLFNINEASQVHVHIYINQYRLVILIQSTTLNHDTCHVLDILSTDLKNVKTACFMPFAKLILV